MKPTKNIWKVATLGVWGSAPRLGVQALIKCGFIMALLLLLLYWPGWPTNQDKGADHFIGH